MNQTISRRHLVAAAGLTLGVAGLASPALSLAAGFVPYSKSSFEAALKADKPVLVHVHASWCPVCKQQEAAFNELSKSPDFAKLTAMVVDFDKDGDFKKNYTINNQSIILVFKGGKEVMRSAGETSKAKLAELIALAAK